MSSSWMDENRTVAQAKNKKGTPSPTLQVVLFHHISRVFQIYQKFMKKISLLISLWGRRKLSGSMTVEATVLLPLLLFFFLHMMGFLEMLRLHGKLEFALWECGNQLSVYMALEPEMAAQLPDVALSYGYVGNSVKSLLGKEYLDESPLVRGSSGLNYLACEYTQECLDIGVSYQVKPPVTLFPFPYMRMVNRYYGHAWTGYDLQKELSYVYVTVYGEVWHSRADCTHIFLTIQEVEKEQVGKLRNLHGAKYYACERCEKEAEGETVFITEQGNRFHKDGDCPALTRYIRAILWQEDIPYRPCSRCVGEKGK